MKNVEQELKLSLDEREYNILLEQAHAEPQLQTNFYFSYRNMPREVMVRIRQKGNVYTLCYKRNMTQIEGVAVSDERECELDPLYADTMLKRGISKVELKRILDVDVDDDLDLVGSLDTYRVKFQLVDWTLELDKNIYLNSVDYELECEHKDVVQLDKLKNYLYYAFGVVIRPSQPKVRRFMRTLENL